MFMLKLLCDLDLDEWMYKVPSDIRTSLEKEFTSVRFSYKSDPSAKEILDCDIYWGNRLKVVSSKKLESHNLKWVHFGSVGYERVYKSNLNLSDLIVTNSYDTMNEGIINHSLYYLFIFLSNSIFFD